MFNEDEVEVIKEQAKKKAEEFMSDYYQWMEDAAHQILEEQFPGYGEDDQDTIKGRIKEHLEESFRELYVGH